MTLIEVLISILLLGTIMSAIGAAVIIAIRQTGEVEIRMSHSHGANLSTTWLNGDVASASSITVSGLNCAGGTRNQLLLTWSEDVVDPNLNPPYPKDSYSATYSVVPDVNNPGEFAVQRAYTQTPATGAGTTITNVVARELDASCDFKVSASGQEIDLTLHQAGRAQTYDFALSGEAGVRIG